MILLWGLSGERPLEAICGELERAGLPAFVLDQRAVLETEIDYTAGERVEGFLRVRDRRIDLAEVTAAYVRPYDARRLPRVAREGPGSEAYRRAVAVDSAVASWLGVTAARVVNPFPAMATNDSKPYQLERIGRLGFLTPDTLLTTDPEAARAFWSEHGEIIYKSVSGVRSRVARLRPEHDRRLDDLACCPTQFQRYIPGIDHRVHVVGDEVFACQVSCDADDYRYPGDSPPVIRACRLAQDVEDRCRRLAADLGLPVAGIDLRLHPSGDWYGFEVNPSPAFTYYEEASGLPIGGAIARFLGAGAPGDATTR